MWGTVLPIASGLVTGVAMIRVGGRYPAIGVVLFGAMALAATALAAWAVVTADWPAAAGLTLSAAANAWFAYLCWKRRKRRRAPRAYGAKSRAMIAALVRKAREAARPRPVLRPLPGNPP